MITLKEKYKYFLNKKLKESKGAGDISKPYKTPRDILAIMSGSAGDDSITTGWAEKNTEEEQGRRRDALSVSDESDGELTAARKKELEASEEILKNVKDKINLPSDKVPSTDIQYGNQEIAAILNARGIFTKPRNKPWSKETVRLAGDKALEKLIAALKNK